MDFVIDTDVLEKYSDLAVGVIVATDIENGGSFPEVAKLLRVEEERVRQELDLETFREHPHLAAMQEVHRSFGNNPNKFPPSIQALVKRILKGGQLPSINPLVDIYNIISLRYLVCAGAENTDACQGNIRLAFANGNEHFRLLGEEEEYPPKPGELVYKDDSGVICRKLNWREGDRTKTTKQTKNAVIVVEGFPPFTQEQLEQALSELAMLVQQYCHAHTRIEVLTQKKPLCCV